MRIIRIVQPFALFLCILSITSCGGGGSGSSVGGSTSNSVYDVTLKSSLAIPVSNPVGLAIDNNDDFWIMAGSHNGSTHTLTCFNPNSGSIIKSFVFQNLIEVLGTGVYGIAWDGSAIWISVSGNTNKLVKVDPNTGQIITNLSSPSNLGPSDLSWDGTNLWISTGTGEVHSINPVNGARTKFLDLGYRDTGIAFKPGEIWISHLDDKSVTVYDISSKNVLDTIDGRLINNGRLTFYHDQLAVLTSAGIDFYDVKKRQ